MRLVIVVVLLGGCSLYNKDTEPTPDAAVDAPARSCEPTPGSWCEAAYDVAESACKRVDTCSPEIATPTCIENGVAQLCMHYDCTAEYNDRARLDACIEAYDRQSCIMIGEPIPVCRL